VIGLLTALAAATSIGFLLGARRRRVERPKAGETAPIPLPFALPFADGTVLLTPDERVLVAPTAYVEREPFAFVYEVLGRRSRVAIDVRDPRGIVLLEPFALDASPRGGTILVGDRTFALEARRPTRAVSVASALEREVDLAVVTVAWYHQGDRSRALVLDGPAGIESWVGERISLDAVEVLGEPPRSV
jgi:hypothetical protein